MTLQLEIYCYRFPLDVEPCLVATIKIQRLYIMIFHLHGSVICGCLSVLSTAIRSVEMQISALREH